MNPNASVLTVGAATLLAATGFAQSTFVVDQLNRPGTSFLDVPAAVAAAQHGDTLILRSDASPYTPTVVDKALTIVGDPSGIAMFTAASPGLLITGIPAGRDVVLRNVEIFGFGGPATPRVRIENCLGRVHLQQVGAGTFAGVPAIDVFACTAVTLRECEAQGAPGLRVESATIAIAGSRCYGNAASAIGAVPAAPGAQFVDSTVWCTNLQCRGGNAAIGLPPAPAAEFVGSSVAATGVPNAANFVAGHYGSSGLSTPVHAVIGQGSLLELDPRVALEARGGAPAVAGVVSVPTPQAVLSVVGNTNLSLTFDGGAGASQITLVGFPGAPRFFAGVGGRLWIDDAAMLVLPGVFGGFSGISEHSLPSAVTLVLQVVDLQGSGAVELTTPAVVTSRR